MRKMTSFDDVIFYTFEICMGSAAIFMISMLLYSERIISDDVAGISALLFFAVAALFLAEVLTGIIKEIVS